MQTPTGKIVIVQDDENVDNVLGAVSEAIGLPAARLLFTRQAGQLWKVGLKPQRE